jgi:hypothetical protein
MLPGRLKNTYHGNFRNVLLLTSVARTFGARLCNGLGNTVQSSNHVLRTRLAWVNNYDGYSESRLNADSPGVSAGTTESILRVLCDPRPRDQP